MTLCLGLDVGTTSISVVALDLADGQVAASANREHQAQILAPDHRLYAEQDIRMIEATALLALGQVRAQLGPRASEIMALGVTGQQHGLALLDESLSPVRPAITWQDQRVVEHLPGTNQSYLDLFRQRAGDADAFDATGCLPAAGYLGPSLFWLMLNGSLEAGYHACFVPDAIATWLTGECPVSDATNGGSSGIFDLIAGDWLWPVIERIGLPGDILPPVAPSGQILGQLRAELAQRTGLPAGLPVTVACGDNQASFLGSVAQPQESLLINIGTGGQISAAIEAFERVGGLDTRAFFGGSYLLVGAGLFGGRTYALLRDFFRTVGQVFYNGQGDETLYDEMTRLAMTVPAGCDGLHCEPLFTGTRQDPSLRGSFTGISPVNLTPGHLIRALLEGMAEGFAAFAEQMRPIIGQRRQLIGAGNGLVKNPLLTQILADCFGQPVQMISQKEAAATGAALVAAVGSGALTSWRDAGRLLHYDRVVAPTSQDG